MPTQIKKNTLVAKRKSRVRGKMFGTSVRPRLTVFRSNKYTYLQVINDENGKVLAVANDKMLNATADKKSKKSQSAKSTKSKRAIASAVALVEQLKKHKITKLQFDRGSYRYHGRVKLVAEAVRSAGIEV